MCMSCHGPDSVISMHADYVLSEAHPFIYNPIIKCLRNIFSGHGILDNATLVPDLKKDEMWLVCDISSAHTHSCHCYHNALNCDTF